MNNISKENTIFNSKVKLKRFSKSLLSVKVRTHLVAVYFFFIILQNQQILFSSIPHLDLACLFKILIKSIEF